MPYDDAHPREADLSSDARADGDTRADVRSPIREPEARPSKEPETTDAAPKEQSADGDKGKQPATDGTKRKSGRVWIILGLLALVLAIAGGAYLYLTRNLLSTDDAYTDGRAVSIAPQVSGYVVELNINDNQYVKTGQVLARIGSRIFIAARDQAVGQLEAAQGQLDNARAALDLARITYPAKLAAAQAQVDAQQAVLARAQQDYQRQHSVSRQATTQTNIDQANAGAKQAVADVAAAQASVLQAKPVDLLIAQNVAQVKQLEGQVAQARAQLDTANINIGYTTIKAPQDGWITKRNVELGNYLTAGASITSLVSPQVWVTANFKEDQLNRMRPGQAVDIAVDAYPSLKLKGHVDSVQLGSGSKFTAFPAENATGNYVKIVQRVPVKIDIDSGLDPAVPLPLGISVEPTVTVK